MKTVSLYLGSAAISLVGNSLAMVVWPWLVLQRTGDPAAAGTVVTAIAVPSLIFAIFGGHLIDTFGRKRMSVVSDVVSGASVVALIAVDTWGQLNLAWFIAIGILGALGDVPGMAARAALAGDVAKASGKSLDMISGVQQTLIGMSMFLGPVLAGLLLANLPISQVLVVTASCSLLAAALTSLVRVTAGEMTSEAFSLHAWLSILKAPMIRIMASAQFIGSMLVTPYLMVLVPAHFQNVNNPTMMGVVHAGYAVGMMVGGAAIAATGSGNRKLVWSVSMLCFTWGFVGMGFLSNQWILLAGMAIAGIGGGVIGPLQMILVTESVPENLRGRAFSLFMAIGQVSSPLGFAVTTVMLTQLSIYTVAVCLAGAWMLSAIVLTQRGLVKISEPAPSA